ncbi:hypothetical protein T492DRAFT_580174, partial [Pavlovales sp. CCMP2436]
RVTRSHHSELVRWLRSVGAECEKSAAANIASEGDHELLKWAIIEQGCPLGQGTAMGACAFGDSAILEWVLEHAISKLGQQLVDFSEVGTLYATLTAAASKGSIAILEWLLSMDVPICGKNNVCEYAASSGHLATLQWLRAHGCEWDEFVIEGAAYGGHLDVLEWAYAN